MTTVLALFMTSLFEKKVLLVSSKYPPEYAGSGLRAHNTYKRLSLKYGIKFDVLASSVTSNRSWQYVVDGVSVKLIASKLNRKISLSGHDGPFWRLAKRIINKMFSLCDYWMEALPTFFYLIRNRRHYDAIHVFGNVNITSAAILYAKITGKPLVVELVNLVDDPRQYEPKPISLIFGVGFPKHALLVCISEYLKRVCNKHGYSDRQIWSRPNPIDGKKFKFEINRKYTCRKKVTCFSDSDTIVLHLAKFIPRKNQDFIVKVMSFLPDNFKLVLVGPLVKSGPLFNRDQEYFESILNSIKSMGIEKRVQVIPEFVKNPEEYIKASNVFVLPSTLEALGTPVLEALACGIPVVANDIPGVFDQWVKDGINGYICKLDHEEWARKIIMAVQIDDDVMKNASRNILSVASTGAIDREYYERLTNILQRSMQ